MPAMRKLIVTFILATALPLFAQEVKPARVIKKAAEAEEAKPTPIPRRSIIDRLFSKPTPAPTPTPTPAPAAKVKPRIAKPKPKPAPTPAPAEPPVEKPAEPTTPPPPTEPAAVPPAPIEKPVEQPKPAKGKPAKPVPAKPAKPDLSGLDDAAKYKAAKELALKEQSIIDLKAKADSTIDEADAKRASLEYNRALFRKVRDIEPSLDAYVDKLEQAVLKRVK